MLAHCTITAFDGCLTNSVVLRFPRPPPFFFLCVCVCARARVRVRVFLSIFYLQYKRGTVSVWSKEGLVFTVV